MKHKKEMKARGYQVNSNGQIINDPTGASGFEMVPHQHKCHQNPGGGGCEEHFRSPGVITSTGASYSANESVKCLSNLTDQIPLQETTPPQTTKRNGKRTIKETENNGEA